jgi:hypothetical protein
MYKNKYRQLTQNIILVHAKGIINNGLDRIRGYDNVIHWCSDSAKAFLAVRDLQKLALGETIGSPMIANHLTGLENRLLLGHFHPRALVLLPEKKASAVFISRCLDNLCRNSAFGGVISGFELCLASKTKGSKSLVTGICIDVCSTPAQNVVFRGLPDCTFNLYGDLRLLVGLCVVRISGLLCRKDVCVRNR